MYLKVELIVEKTDHKDTRTQAELLDALITALAYKRIGTKITITDVTRCDS